MTDSFDLIPNEGILNIALFLPIHNITVLCVTSNRFNNVVCSNEYFWKQKFINDYHFVPNNIVSWKELYKNYLNAWGFGSNDHGQLASLNNKEQNKPYCINNLKPKRVSAGEL